MTTVRLILLFLILGTGVCAASAPTEVTLSSGATLRNVSIVRWQGRDTVVLKHLGGVAPIQLRHMSADSRAAFEALRLAAPPPSTAPSSSITLRGEVFINTASAANGIHKFGNAEVTLYPAEDYDYFISEVRKAWSINRDSTVVRPTPDPKEVFAAVQSVIGQWKDRAVGTTRTTSEGLFEVVVPRAVFVVCLAERTANARVVGSSGFASTRILPVDEKNVWAVKPPDSGPFILSNTNLLHRSL